MEIKNKIIIYVDKDTKKVTRVEVKFPKDTTEEKLAEVVKKFNDNENNTSFVIVKNLDEQTYEAFRFLLGKDGYKTTYDLSNLKVWIEDLKDKIEDFNNQRFDIEYEISNLIKKIGT